MCKCVCVWLSGYLFACAYRRLQRHSQVLLLPPAGWFGLAFLAPLSRHVSGSPVRAARNPWPVLSARLASSTRARTTPSPPSGACFVSVVCCCIGAPVVDVGMYVCGAALCVLWCAAASPNFRRTLEALGQTSTTSVGSPRARYSDAY